MATRPIEVVIKERKISEIVNPRLVQAPPTITINQAVELMQRNKAGYIVVAKDKKAVGLFTEDEFLDKILDKNVDWNRPIAEFMTPDPPVLNIKASVGEAIDLMGEGGFYHIPLVNDKKDLVNVISVRTLIRFLAEFYPTEIYNLPPRADQVMETPEGG